MMRLRRYSVALYRELQVFETVGSVRIASGEASWLDLRRAASRAAGAGFEAQLISPDEVLERLPEADGAPIFGGVWVPDDGWVDPHIATYAVADAARALGVEIRIRTRVTGIELGPGRAVRAVVTDQGRIETEHVVNAAGIWAPQVAAMVGAFLPSIPVDHQHVTMQAVAGHEIPRDAPCFRDTDNLVYGKAEAGGLLVGGYEPNPTARWADGVPWDHGASPVESDMDRFAPLLEGAIRRFPMLEEAGVVRLLCHPDAMTPDGNPLLGPMPGVRGFWVAAGLSLNGFGGAGGLGRSLAEWMTEGETELDVDAYRAWRFGGVYRDTVVQAETAREAYKYYYRLRYPLDSAQAGRGRRLSPLHGRPRGARRGLRRQERLGARGLPRARPAVAASRRGPTGLRLDAAALLRPARRGARRLPGTRRDHRPLVLRQDRGAGSRRARAARSRQRQPDGSAGRSRDLHAVPQPGRGDRRRPHRHAACCRTSSGS
jgi:glycine/D-amino acid oxidase-like deaminating enzyme